MVAKGTVHADIKTPFLIGEIAINTQQHVRIGIADKEFGFTTFVVRKTRCFIDTKKTLQVEYVQRLPGNHQLTSHTRQTLPVYFTGFHGAYEILYFIIEEC